MRSAPGGTRKAASLLPREHGAYAMVAFPSLTGLAMAGLRAAPLLLVVSSAAAFLAHEPVNILVGARGGRARSDHGGRATRRAAWLTLIAAATGLTGLWLGGPAARYWAIAPLALLALWLPLILRRAEKTPAGESLVAVTLASLVLPIAASGGVPGLRALPAALVWSAVFVLGTLTVHGVIGAAKKKGERKRFATAAPVASAGAILAAVALAASNKVALPIALAVLPVAAVGLAFSLVRIHPRHLRALGWSLVASNLAAFLLLLIGLR